MKQLAMLYAMQKFLPRLRQVRRSTWILLGSGVLLLGVLFVWVAFSVLSWLWGQTSGVLSNGREVAGTAMERVGELAPELKQTVEPWIGAINLPGEKTATLQEVSGMEPAGLTRYPGLVRVFYQRQPDASENRYMGVGALPEVVEHYRNQLEKAGFQHEIRLAEAGREQHRFILGGQVLELELKQVSSSDKLELSLIERKQ